MVCLCGVIHGQQAQTFVPSDVVNSQLPGWVRFSGEYRARFEGFTGGGYKPDSDDAYLLNRFRLNMKLIPTGWLKLIFQAQDARVFWKNQNPAAPPYQDTFDLRMAFAEIGDMEKGSVALRVGRQELAFGEQRLIGHANWLNTARTFDAARLTLRRNGYRLDAFASSVVNARDGEWNHHQQGNNLHGLYAGADRLIPNAVLEAYTLWRVAPWFANPVNEHGTRGKLDSHTTGVRFAGKLPRNVDYGTEMATQMGSLGTDGIRAWAGEWRLGYTLTRFRYKPHFTTEYNYASGDANPKDGKRGTFDPLYPTAHDKYGLSDQVGWRNIHHLHVGPDFKVSPKLTLSSNYHSWWLASATDALYAASGAAVARVANGTAGRHVGQELDGQATWQWNKQTQVAGGFAHIFPGQFLQKATPGRSYNYPFVMIGYSF